MESVLPLIEEAFGDLMLHYGFRLGIRTAAKSPEYVDAVQFVKAAQSISVLYAHTREQWCEVALQGYGDPEPVSDLLPFVRYASGNDVQYVSTTNAKDFLAEAKRWSGLLGEYCSLFLSGDIRGFRRAYRELFLVTLVRNARYNADAEKNWREFSRYHVWLRDYWTEYDLEEAALAKRRGWRE
jgi:hypothetical protein